MEDTGKLDGTRKCSGKSREPRLHPPDSQMCMDSGSHLKGVSFLVGPQSTLK